MADHFQTISGRAEFRQKIERSEFLGIAFPAVTEEQFFSVLARLSKEHFDATHHCWAFRLVERVRSSDAGEPSGTAGRPILAAIESAHVFEVGLVVVRWYGGVKLGTGGLSRAYRDTAVQTIATAERLDRYRYTRFRVRVPFAAFGTVYRLVSPPDVVLVEENFEETTEFVFDVRDSRAAAFGAALTEHHLTFTN